MIEYHGIIVFGKQFPGGCKSIKPRDLKDLEGRL